MEAPFLLVARHRGRKDPFAGQGRRISFEESLLGLASWQSSSDLRIVPEGPGSEKEY